MTKHTAPPATPTPPAPRATPTPPAPEPPRSPPTEHPAGAEASPPYNEALRKARLGRQPGPPQAPGQAQTLVEPKVGSGG